MRRHAGFAMLFAVAGTLCGSCDPLDLTTTSEVIRLRVLAIEAEPAEIAFGGDVVLQPLIADPWNEGYAPQWMPCIEAEIAGFAACDFENLLVDLSDPFSMAALAQERLEFTVDQSSIHDLLAERDPVDRAEGVSLQFILMLLPRNKTFFDYLPEFDVTQLDDPDYLAAYEQEAGEAMNEVFEALIRQSRIAYKRVIVSDLASVGIATHTEGACAEFPGLLPNAAPHLGGLLSTREGIDTPHASGATIEVPMGGSVELRPLWNPDDQESYYHVAWDGSTECRTENPFFGWYATDGSYSASSGFSGDYSYLDESGDPSKVEWKAPRDDPVHDPIEAWMVVWDRRGGMDFLAFRFDLVEAEP